MSAREIWIAALLGLWVVLVHGGNWVQVTTTGTFNERAYSSAALHTASRSVYIFGGAGGEDNALLADVVKYNVDTANFSRVSTSGNAPLGRSGHGAAFIGDEMFVVGGDALAVVNGRPRETGATYRLDVGTRVWSARAALSTPRQFHSVSAYATSLYVFGGAVNLTLYSDLHEYDSVGNTWSVVSPGGAAPPARQLHAAAVVGNTLYIYGGLGAAAETFSDMYSLDLDTPTTWVLASSPGSQPNSGGRAGAAIAVVGSRLFLMGGLGSSFHSQLTNNLWEHDPGTDEFSELAANNATNAATMPATRHGHSMVAVNDTVYVFGGNPYLSQDYYLGDVWKYVVGLN